MTTPLAIRVLSGILALSGAFAMPMSMASGTVHPLRDSSVSSTFSCICESPNQPSVNGVVSSTCTTTGSCRCTVTLQLQTGNPPAVPFSDYGDPVSKTFNCSDSGSANAVCQTVTRCKDGKNWVFCMYPCGGGTWQTFNLSTICKSCNEE